MTNQDVKKVIKNSRFYGYEIAAKIGISEYTLCRWFRRDLSEEQQKRILTAISELKAGSDNEN